MHKNKKTQQLKEFAFYGSPILVVVGHVAGHFGGKVFFKKRKKNR